MVTYLIALLVLAVVLLIVAALNGLWAPLMVHLRTDLSSARGEPQPVQDPTAPFVGLALSGGGARAAVFAAAGMKALHARGLLDPVTHVSSVSGGGFSAAYLAAHPVPQGAQASAYFDRMVDVVAHDYFKDVQLRQLAHPLRAFSPSRRLLSLQEALERPDFLHQIRFADLPAHRTFFFNTVSYDTAQRVVFSNGVLPASRDPQSPSPLPARLRALTFSDASTARSTPGDMPVALAVATSAAFPPYLGPMTLELTDGAGQPPRYWHLGDGGVLENSGVETLREAIYARGPGQTATIYAFNAGLQLDSDLSENTLDISLWSRDVTRLVDVLLDYAGAHRDTNAEMLDRANGMKIDLISFNYLDIARLVKSGEITDPRWLSWDGWAHATAADRAQSATPAEHLAKIPTALKISPCDRDLIAAAADSLVQYRFM